MIKRNRARAVAVAAALVGLAWPAAQALAQTAAYTSQPVDLFAGPSEDYPVVSEIDGGVPVTVMGCLSDYSWCDVAMPGLRGWMYAAYLSYPYEGEYVPLQGYGAVIGLPIIGFSFGTYWDSFYRNRPWYGDRDRWAHVRPHEFGGRPSGPPPGGRPLEGRPQAVRPPQGRPPEGIRPEGRLPQGRPQEGARQPEARQPEGARPPQPGRPFVPPATGGRPDEPPVGGHLGPQQRFPGNAGGPRPDMGARTPGQPGGNFGQPRPMPQEAAPRPQAPQPQGGGFHPGGPAGGFEHGAPQMHAPGPMPAPERQAAPPQGGHPSGGEGGGGHRDRQQGQ